MKQNHQGGDGFGGELPTQTYAQGAGLHNTCNDQHDTHWGLLGPQGVEIMNGQQLANGHFVYNSIRRKVI